LLFFILCGIIQPLNEKGEDIMKNKKKEIKKLIFSIISVSLFLMFMTSFVYLPKQENLLSSMAFLQNQKRFYMQDLSSGILLKDAYPTSDSTGLKNDAYKFKIVNNSNSKITYQIVFQNNEEQAKLKGKEVLPNKYLRYVINKENEPFKNIQNLSDDGILYTATIDAKSEETFEFRMWLDYNADNGAMDKIFIGKIELVEVK
jgi:hypothetical protein